MSIFIKLSTLVLKNYQLTTFAVVLNLFQKHESILATLITLEVKISSHVLDCNNIIHL